MVSDVMSRTSPGDLLTSESFLVCEHEAAEEEEQRLDPTRLALGDPAPLCLQNWIQRVLEL